jgi:hypothetical protein
MRAADIIKLHASDPAAARREALALLALEEDPVFNLAKAPLPSDDTGFLALLTAGVLTNDDFADHSAALAQRDHDHDRREVGVSARDIIQASISKKESK